MDSNYRCDSKSCHSWNRWNLAMKRGNKAWKERRRGHEICNKSHPNTLLLPMKYSSSPNSRKRNADDTMSAGGRRATPYVWLTDSECEKYDNRHIFGNGWQFIYSYYFSILHFSQVKWPWKTSKALEPPCGDLDRAKPQKPAPWRTSKSLLGNKKRAPIVAKKCHGSRHIAIKILYVAGPIVLGQI